MKSHLTRREFVYGSAAAVAAGLTLPQWSPAADADGLLTFENQFVKYVISPDARSLQFIDKQTGRDYCGGKAPIARVKKSGKPYDASSARFDDGRLTLAFGDSGAQAVLKATVHPQHLVFEVLSVTGEGVEEFTIADIPLTLQGTAGEPFAACALALNLQTYVEEIPQATSRLRAVCFPRFGMVGGKVALIAAPRDKFRTALQEAVSAAEELPQSSVGGPWALDAPINRGSYLLDAQGIKMDQVDQWVDMLKSIGLNQFDFHGNGGFFRFGDCRPNPEFYPEGVKSLKVVIDKLHAAGIAVGLHTYAFFINKDCPWVTPVPDPRLASDAALTLSADLASDATVVPVDESTAGMSAVTGFFVRNSNTLRIDDELIEYFGVAKEPPFGFTGCLRGTRGTRVSSHAKGAKAYHLKECFGLFVPDPETTLFEEVAAATANMFNVCGFDMIYLDALDGEDILAGAENGWHYGSRFVYEICKRLKKPALMEMSAFHHHLWCVRSRLGAWDHPRRSYKRFIDIHCAGNEICHKMFLPAQLGWWAFETWSGPNEEPTFSDDIEYLMGKCLGTGAGLSLANVNVDAIRESPAKARLATITRRYEELRHSDKVSESIKARLRAPGDEFTLVGNLQEGWAFRPAQYSKHKVESAEAWSSRWKNTNKFAAQPLRLRIEALMAAGPYDAPDNLILADFASPDDFPNREAAPSITTALAASREIVRVGAVSGCIAATNNGNDRAGSWAKMEKTFAPPKDMKGHQALGLWIHGDGQGEVLNLQLKSPSHLISGIADHYIIIDFSGWRYFELIESEGDRFADYRWPYGDLYSIYRESVDLRQIETLGLWCNTLPPGKTTTCCLGPIKAMPLVPNKLVQPTVSIGGQTIAFPVEIPTGHYLEFFSADECVLYGPKGEVVQKVQLPGPIPIVPPGENEVAFQAQTLPGLSLRAKVTLVSHGEAMR